MIYPDFLLYLNGFFPVKHLVHIIQILTNKMQEFRKFVLTSLSLLIVNEFTRDYEPNLIPTPIPIFFHFKL